MRHAHSSHAIERGASLPEVQATLGHGNISTNVLLFQPLAEVSNEPRVLTY
jgi:site-specific recombinase XerD